MLEFEWLFNQSALEIRPICMPSSATFSGVQTNELEDATEFIKQDSVVLTIAIAFKDREDELAKYLTHLAEAGAVAVGIGTGLIFPTVPQSVIDAAHELGIGLFEVPRPIAFISIVSAVHQELNRRNDIAQRRLLDAQETLTHTATRGSLTDLLHETAYLLDGELRIVNERGEVVMETSPPLGHKFFTSYDMTTHGERSHTLKAESEHPFSAEDRSLIRHCAGLADMLLARPVELRQARNELNSFALRLTLGLPDATSPSQTLPATLDFPRDKDGFTRPVIALAEDSRSLERAHNALDAQLETHGQFLYTAQFDKHSFVALFSGDADTKDIVAMFGNSMRVLRVAIGKRIASTELAFDHVQELLDRARPLPLGEYLSPHSQNMPWLNASAVRKALASRRRETINVLRTIDAESNSDLARTLTVYLRKGGQLNQTAEALNVHRHTVRNRVAHIEKVCEIDLSEPTVFAELLFAVVQESASGSD
ncbi:transcriptional regulator [Corynebacterium ammoniagenes DSM 20306]|uniref:Phage tail component domain protein n=2 Tax=Corynebacterium ammoniagenes TaxID=1697 RepID=A0ABP2IA91_CORAM|nr:transcriptional regulator [Corynebacterium ammoniagenes DSM 20306]AQS73170.1 transcriptional regulator [Corynebacterium ammoniagenes]EFG80395.1 putative phage tail component domain protein [Corynebacterium ammoniagenes DSM 20306]